MRKRARYRAKHSRKVLYIVGTLLLASVVIGGIVFTKKANAPVEDTPTTLTDNSSKKLRVEGRYLFNGTVNWARKYESWSKRTDGTTDYGYPFSGLSTFRRENYDAWVADLECASDIKELTKQQIENQLVFNCHPEYLSEARKFFDIFTLANSQTDSLGLSGFDQTKKNLTENGIQYVGHYEPTKLEDICEVIALPVRVISEQNGKESDEQAELPVAFCAWNYFQRQPGAGELEQIEQYASVMPVFAFVQAGAEYKPKADADQVAIAHKIADLGPQVVIMNGSHWVQNGEVYNGVPIMYSTGNFIFDLQTNTEVTRSVSLDTTMQISYNSDVQTWLDLAKQCKVPKDSCLQNAVSVALPKLNPKMSYDIVVGDGGDKLQKLASEAITSSVKERVGWTSMKTILETKR